MSTFLWNIHVLYLFKLLYLKSVFLGKRRIRLLMNYYLCSPHLLNQIGLNEINWIKLDQTDWIKPNQTRSYRFITIYWTYPCSNCTLCVYEFSQSKLKLLNNQIKKSVNPIPSGGTFFPPHYYVPPDFQTFQWPRSFFVFSIKNYKNRRSFTLSYLGNSLSHQPILANPFFVEFFVYS